MRKILSLTALLVVLSSHLFAQIPTAQSIEKKIAKLATTSNLTTQQVLEEIKKHAEIIAEINALALESQGQDSHLDTLLEKARNSFKNYVEVILKNEIRRKEVAEKFVTDLNTIQEKIESINEKDELSYLKFDKVYSYFRLMEKLGVAQTDEKAKKLRKTARKKLRELRKDRQQLIEEKIASKQNLTFKKLRDQTLKQPSIAHLSPKQIVDELSTHIKNNIHAQGILTYLKPHLTDYQQQVLVPPVLRRLHNNQKVLKTAFNHPSVKPDMLQYGLTGFMSGLKDDVVKTRGNRIEIQKSNAAAAAELEFVLDAYPDLTMETNHINIYQQFLTTAGLPLDKPILQEPEKIESTSEEQDENSSRPPKNGKPFYRRPAVVIAMMILAGISVATAYKQGLLKQAWEKAKYDWVKKYKKRMSDVKKKMYINQLVAVAKIMPPHEYDTYEYNFLRGYHPDDVAHIREEVAKRLE